MRRLESARAVLAGLQHLAAIGRTTRRTAPVEEAPLQRRLAHRGFSSLLGPYFGGGDGRSRWRRAMPCMVAAFSGVSNANSLMSCARAARAITLAPMQVLAISCDAPAFGLDRLRVLPHEPFRALDPSAGGAAFSSWRRSCSCCGGPSARPPHAPRSHRRTKQEYRVEISAGHHVLRLERGSPEPLMGIRQIKGWRLTGAALISANLKEA